MRGDTEERDMWGTPPYPSGKPIVSPISGTRIQKNTMLWLKIKSAVLMVAHLQIKRPHYRQEIPLKGFQLKQWPDAFYRKNFLFLGVPLI